MLPSAYVGSAVTVSQVSTPGDSGALGANAWSEVIPTGKTSILTATGLTLNPANGQITGTPTKVAVLTFSLKLTNVNGHSDTETFVMNVVAAGKNQTLLNLPVELLDGVAVSPTPIDIDGTATSLLPNLPITYGTDTPNVCYVDSTNTLFITGAGTCTVSATSGSGATLSKVVQSFTTTKANQMITAPVPSANDDPRGFKIVATVSSGLSPNFEVVAPLVGEPACSVEDDGTVTWQADITTTPVPAANLVCDVKVSQPGDAGYNAATPVTVRLNATHVDVELPADYIQQDPAVTNGMPRTGGTVSKGGVGFVVKIDAKKKTFTVKPISRGLYIGPITAEITIEYKKANVTLYQRCTTTFGIKAASDKPADVKKVIAPYLKMPKYGPKGYLAPKKFENSASCTLNKDAYAYFVSGAPIKAVADVTRDRRWPTTYAKAKPNGTPIVPAKVRWNLSIG
jgi:hypothetical protein